MRAERLDLSDAELLRRVFTIHDEMPVEWIAAHEPSSKRVDELILKTQAAPESNALWILREGSGEICGILWAVTKKAWDDLLICSINSIWVDPKQRLKNLTPLLSQPCLAWAREQGAGRLECHTHFNNHRMREILEKNQLLPGYLQYTLALEPV